MALTEEIGERLRAAGVASSSGAGGWLLYRGGLWDADSASFGDRAIAVVETGGRPPAVGAGVAELTFELLFRGPPLAAVADAYDETRARAELARRALHEWQSTGVLGAEYLLVLAEGEPVYAGEDGSMRPLFTLGFRAFRRDT